MNRLTCLLLCILAAARPAFANDAAIAVSDDTREAYTQAIPALAETDRAKFLKGRALVRQVWVIPPSENREIAGLGPLYNRLSCIACHPANGHGFAPESAAEPMRAMLVRLSVPGKDPHGGPLPHAAYGGQLNENGVPGVTGEGRTEVHYRTHTVSLSGGEMVKLRQPEFRFVDLAYGDFPASMMTSSRIGSPIFGLGLLEAVPEGTLVALAAVGKPAGIKGKVNYVWDAELKKSVPGRFGWKANMPNLRQQIAGAMVGDLGITSPLFPQENCMLVQSDCAKSPSDGKPELSAAQLDATEFYHFALAAPQPRNNGDKQVKRGAVLFGKAQCAACHVPELKTGEFAKYPALSNRTIHPYTDLLLHDMGEALADHRPDYLANGREWRTPPLWGIGLAQKIEARAGFLHDGRARSLLEAVLWHGGEGAGSTQAVKDMTAADRNALIDFLESL
ncbi:MAG: di-heme oxidoredictase family protein [Sideroxyarcus sp.]|nr:di-heme oxidoredictase family protein [Sideroxyarcus sp.]